MLLNLFLISKCLAQQTNTNEYNTIKNDIKNIVEIFPDSAFKKANNLVEIAKQNKSQKQIAEAYKIIAEINLTNSNLDFADSINNVSYELNKKNKIDEGVADNLSLFGSIAQNKSQFVEATAYYLKSNKIAEKLKLSKQLNFNHRALSKINLIQKNLEKSFFYLQKALNDTNITVLDSSYTLQSFADFYSNQYKLDSAEYYYKKAYQLLEANKYDYRKAYIKALWAQIYSTTDMNKTISTMLDAQEVFDKIAPNSSGSVMNVNNIGIYYFMLLSFDSSTQKLTDNRITKTKDFILKESERYMQRSIDLSEKRHSLYDLYYAYGNMAAIKAYKKDFESAYNYSIKSFEKYDSVFSQKNKNAIAKLEAERDLTKLNAINLQKSNLNKLLIIIISAISIISFLVYRNFKQKQNIQKSKIAELETERQLSAVDAMLKGQENERHRLAQDLHDGLGGLLSGVKLSFNNIKENLVIQASDIPKFENSINQLDNAIVELRKVSHNLMPETLLKFGLESAVSDFCKSMQVSTGIKVVFQALGVKRNLESIADLYIYRIVQELVNNAIKYADAKQIIVQISKTNDKVYIAVEDDGEGFDTNIKPAGIGLESVLHRANYFRGNMNIDSNISQGTSINIELNI